ncbi:family 16 glycosylhydrolase [Serratia proteamaculans]|uniref:family 16 glycosylhydrolase n=1 Tax=Serratia proteamaculans TaxID=28151 RepID=UPI003CF96BBE
MNIKNPLKGISHFFYSFYLRARLFLPAQKSLTFSSLDKDGSFISKVYVINLDREVVRWLDLNKEFNKILDKSNKKLTEQVVRFSAINAKEMSDDINGEEVFPYYTLADQLYVDPHPKILPGKFDLDVPIKMSKAEIAVALSHINVIKLIAEGSNEYALILEDDVYFESDFAKTLDAAWSEMTQADQSSPNFDILYLSFKEVMNGARKKLISKNIFKPERGLWYFSGYVLSKKGAKKILSLLPIYGPIDLWINHQFEKLDVRAVHKSIISQRLDFNSSNSYSILPTLVKVGVIDNEKASNFNELPNHWPVFSFGVSGSGISSLGMALSMLGYRCCSDIDRLPNEDLKKLLDNTGENKFNAYVNVGCLSKYIDILKKEYPQAKFIITVNDAKSIDKVTSNLFKDLSDVEYITLHSDENKKWKVICEYLQCAPPISIYPEIEDIEPREIIEDAVNIYGNRSEINLIHDISPWVLEKNVFSGSGFQIKNNQDRKENDLTRFSINDSFQSINNNYWELRDDTFPGNLGLFRPENVFNNSHSGLSLVVKEEQLGVRDYSAAAISSRMKFLYGKFEVSLRASNIPGLVTGFFLHRDSPRQEIDIEFVGNKTDHMLVNVFYNPGDEGAKFDYGYRGTPTLIPLGFDASESFHDYIIEWNPDEIKWFVDGVMVYRRGVWGPTPIPHLPMTLHANTWPTRSKELAGRLHTHSLPGITYVRKIYVDATINIKNQKLNEQKAVAG